MQVLNSSSSDDNSDDEDCIVSRGFVKHIRKAFIAIDEERYCEFAIIPDLRVFNSKVTHETRYRKEKTNQEGDRAIDDARFKMILSKRFEADAYEYARVQNQKGLITANRPRSGQSFKLDSKIVNPHVEPNDPLAVESNKQFVFEIRKEADLKAKLENMSAVSPLTQLLSQQTNEHNPFAYYAKFEAHAQEPNQTQKFRIYLPMCDAIESLMRQISDPVCPLRSHIDISVYKSARISDLIGLACCKYVVENKKPSLKGTNPSDFELKMTEEDGEIDEEFPPLDANKSVSIFGFSKLALVEKVASSNRDDTSRDESDDDTEGGASSYSDFNESTNPYLNKVTVIVHFTDGNPSQVLVFDSENTPMRKVFEEMCQIKAKSVKIFCPLLAYRMEHIDQPGVPVDFNLNLNQYKPFQFYFFRENSTRRLSTELTPLEKSSSISEKTLTEQHKNLDEFREYKVIYLSKWKKVPFKLELSKDALDLEEIKTKNVLSNQLKSKFYTIQMRYVMDVVDLKEKATSSGKSAFRIIVLEPPETKLRPTAAQAADVDSGYKHLDFECDTAVAEDLKQTCLQLIDFTNSAEWKHYTMNNGQMIASTKWSRRAQALKKKNSLASTH